jgi:mono/diheme cytochrome c family protein
MDELLAAAAKATGMSETMVKRSAAARAKAQGTTVEAVLAEWAGVAAPAGSAVPVAPAPAAAAPVAAAPAAAPAAPGLEVEERGEDIATAAAPAPAPVVVAPEVVPTGAIPRWLAALFVAVPLFALAYLAFLPNGPSCGDAGRMALDPLSGEMVNCDGSAIGGESEIDYFALGEEVYGTRGCIACHGPGGAGAANFPAFTGGALLTTFPEGSCPIQQDWIRLGTTGWPDATYGATNKPVGGSGAVMPAWGSVLTVDEIHAVALYERVAFGGEEIEAAKVDCAGTATDAPAATAAATGG